MGLAFTIPAGFFGDDSIRREPTTFIIITLIGILTGGFAGLLFYVLIKRPLRAADQKQTDMLGREPSYDEKVELYAWYKSGKKPSTKTIRPLLPKYLDYMEMRLNGSYANSYIASKSFRTFLLLLALFNLLQAVIHLTTIDYDLFIGICNVVGCLGFSAAYLNKPDGKPQTFAIKVNARRLAKIQAMRQQL